MRRLARGFVLTGLAVSLAGCGTLPRNPVPPELTPVASIPGMPEMRAWAGRPNEAMERDFERSVQQESPVDFPRGADGVVRYPHLALSGGGANGAFGAGFLAGWSATGRLPVFKMVTGVSTGALMAPFAFLGPQYDAALHKFYTTTATRDIFAMRSILISLVRGYSLADTGPLAALITRHVDAEFLRQVGDAHNRGRRLYIGTVDLDSQQFVVWNTGLIAARGGPEALDLVRKVMLASAAIPIAFPPVFFEVEADGRRYDEMHVDGAVAATVFLNAGVFRPSLSHERAGRGTARTPRSLRGIASRVIEASVRAGVVNDLVRIFAFAQRDQASFRWVTIDESIDLEAAEVFDPVKMAELYEIGYRTARAGPDWEIRPPGFQEVQPPP